MMMDAYPICFNSATAAGVVAPAQAIVVSTREKFVTPGTDSFVTCARAATGVRLTAAAMAMAMAIGRRIIFNPSSRVGE